MDVVEVVGDPCGDELLCGDGSEFGVGAFSGEVVAGEIQVGEGFEVFGSDCREFVEEVFDGPALVFLDHGVSVEGVEWFVSTVVENDVETCDPVAAFSVDEVAYNVEGAEGVGAVIGRGPDLDEVVEHGMQGVRCASEDSCCVGQIELHVVMLPVSFRTKRVIEGYYGQAGEVL